MNAGWRLSGTLLQGRSAPESLMTTMLRLLSSRPSTQRRKLRPVYRACSTHSNTHHTTAGKVCSQTQRGRAPIRPKPLMATFSFLPLHSVTCLAPTVPCAANIEVLVAASAHCDQSSHTCAASYHTFPAPQKPACLFCSPAHILASLEHFPSNNHTKMTDECATRKVGQYEIGREGGVQWWPGPGRGW